MKTRLRSSRTAAELTQSELAEKAGVSRQTIHAIESGKYVPSTVLALKFAAILQLEISALFELEEGDWGN